MASTKTDVDVAKLVTAMTVLAQVNRGIVNTLRKLYPSPAVDDLANWSERKLTELLTGLGVES